MILGLLRQLIWLVLRLRYRIVVRGLEQVRRHGRSGIVFLPNHPALIDPVIMMTLLGRAGFEPRALADRDQVDRFFIRYLARKAGVRTMPDLARHGRQSAESIRAMLAKSIEGLRRGENLLLYPAGRIYRSRLEELGGNSAVELILRHVPDVRVVLVRTVGLWGSGFSRASGHAPQVGKVLWRGIRGLLASGLFFALKRPVEIELVELADLPRQADRFTINRYLEAFYNQAARPNTYVPYSRWERGGTRPLPEPSTGRKVEDAAAVPASTRELVASQLRELSGREKFSDSDRLGADLGLDSLARTELAVWLEKQFGFPQSGDALQTVTDVLLAACGESLGGEAAVTPPAGKWFVPLSSERLALPDGATITEVFLEQYAQGAGRAILADQTGGVRTFRQAMMGVLALRPRFAQMPGQYLGIMLPASSAATVSYLAALFAGKTPVMVNWTTGPRNIQHSLDALGVQKVLTARALVARLSADGLDLSAISDKLVYLEDLAGSLGRLEKLRVALKARLGWRELYRAAPPETAVVLFTSGSENLPKAVPLTHANILTNLRDVLAAVTLHSDDALLGMLPPFHAFGLTVGVVLPPLSGMRVAYWPNPNDAAGLAAAVEAYRLTLLVGTPTFLAGIVRAARPGQLDSLRLAVTGAEKCPPRVSEALASACPRAIILEGYGITECSPIVALNDETAPRPGTIGRLLPSLAGLVVDVQTLAPLPAGQTGLLLVSGPSVFGGYLPLLSLEGRGQREGEVPAAPSPFEETLSRRWYNTGDLVSMDESGVLTFHGRLKRFAKLGGEMVSLPAIEAVLEAAFGNPEQPGATLAVEAWPPENGELVLFSTNPVSREQANLAIRSAGLSPLHNIRRVIYLQELPLLGSGKTDYRALRARLAGE